MFHSGVRFGARGGLALALAISLGACSDSEKTAADAGPDAGPDAAADRGADRAGEDAAWNGERVAANPLVPRKPALPFPCDFYLVKDETTVTLDGSGSEARGGREVVRYRWEKEG